MKNSVKLIISVSVLLTLFTQFSRMLSAQEKKDAAKPEPQKIPDNAAPPHTDYCVECHEKLAGRLKSPVAEWRESVHITKGACNVCHGGNSALNDRTLSKNKNTGYIGRPDKKNMTDFCGRGGCHAGTIALFRKGPHYQTVLKSGEPNCAGCHGFHGIKSHGTAFQEKTCAGCHDVTYVNEVIFSLARIDRGIRQIEKNVEFLKKRNVDYESISARRAVTKQLFHGLVHTLTSDEMRSKKKIIDLEVENLLSDSETKVLLTKRLNLLYVILALFGSSVIIGFIIYTLRMISKRAQ